MKSKFQTLSGFLHAPFNVRQSLDRDLKYEGMYKKAMQDRHGIRIFATTKLEDSYYFHIKIPSDSSAKQGTKMEYDVVIRFFSEDPEIKSQNNLQNYYIQFYSNSPSFIYQYAYLYNTNGYLIKELYSKTDQENINKPPEKTNSKMEMSYDKSIYFACRYLEDTKLRHLTKTFATSLKQVPYAKFFRAVSDFETSRLTRELLNEEKRLSKEIQKEKTLNREDPKRILKKLGTTSTGETSKSIRRITAGGKKPKIKSKKSTRR